MRLPELVVLVAPAEGASARQLLIALLHNGGAPVGSCRPLSLSFDTQAVCFREVVERRSKNNVYRRTGQVIVLSASDRVRSPLCVVAASVIQTARFEAEFSKN